MRNCFIKNTLFLLNVRKAWILIGILMALVTIIRIRLLNVPLERDEGEYAYMGQLILQGIPPYKIVYNMKFPGTYYMYALIMSVFRQTTAGIHTGLLVINLTTILMLFLLVKEIIGNRAAIIAAYIFAILSLSFSMGGFAGHATHFLVFPALAGTYFLFKAVTVNRKVHYLLSGFLLGLAPIMKQPGIFFCAFGGIYILIDMFFLSRSVLKASISRLLLFIAGTIIPFTVMIVLLRHEGAFEKFWFWTIRYAADYGKQVGIKNAFMMFKTTVSLLIKGYTLIWIISGLGLVALFLHPRLRNNFRITFILLFLVFSFLAICPGFYFREHYFIVLIPAIAILFSVVPDYLSELSITRPKIKFLKYISIVIIVVPVVLGFLSQKKYCFKFTPNEISREVYGLNPFPESILIAQYLNANTEKEDKIAVLGSEPQIFFYADRHSATGYIYTYSLMEKHENAINMQIEMISEIEAAHPRYLIYCFISTSWLANENSETYIFDWINPYLQNNHFILKGIIDIDYEKTIYKWDNEALNYAPESDFYIQVFEREMYPIN